MELAKIAIDEISERIDPSAIKNFIVSNPDMPMCSFDISKKHPFILDGVSFAICIGGAGRLKINFKEYELKKNSTITILPHFVTELIESSDDFVIEFLIFSVDFITHIPNPSNFDISKNIIQNPCIVVSDEQAQILLDFHSFIVKQYQRVDHPFRAELVKLLLVSLLTEVGGIYSRMGTSSNNVASNHQEEIMYKFFKLLLEHHRTERSLTFYADKMCITSKYLSTVVKRTSGRTAFAWINDAIISSAKYMLKTSSMTILQISEELSFPNASFFGRFFKKYTKMTPLQYRRSELS